MMNKTWQKFVQGWCRKPLSGTKRRWYGNLFWKHKMIQIKKRLTKIFTCDETFIFKYD